MGAVLPCFTVAGLGCGLAFSPGLPCCAGAGLPCAFALPGCAAFVLAVLLFELDTLVVVLELLPVELDALDAFVLVDVVVPDVDTHHDWAAGAGPEIVKALRDEDFGDRDTICRDPEGHVWSFDSYDPRSG